MENFDLVAEKENDAFDQSLALNKLSCDLLTVCNRQRRRWQVAFFALLGLDGIALLLYYFHVMGVIS